jgi:hypothetical protein
MRKIAVKELLTHNDMSSIRPYTLRNSGPDTSIVLRLCLRGLVESIGLPSDMAQQQIGQEELVIPSSDKSLTDSAPIGSELRQRKPQALSDSKFGQIRLTLHYDTNKSSLVVTVHQCKNLIPCDSDSLADPYVRMYLLPDRSASGKRKTQPIKNSLNPNFDDAVFEWSIGMNDLNYRTLECLVKNQVGVFARGRVTMGILRLDLSTLSNLANTPITKWYQLSDPEGNELARD